MNFPIKPHDILSLTEDAVTALASAPGSVRRAYVCVIMAAPMGEHVAAAMGFDPSDYRNQIEQQEPALKLLRDLGNYAKHVHITRYAPKAASLASYEAVNAFRSLADIMEDGDEDEWREDLGAEGFYLRDSSAQVHSLLSILRSVIYFWREELLRLDLMQ